MNAMTLFLKTLVIPDVRLIAIMAFAITIDFITGVVKAKSKGEARTSNGFRRTVNKITQYTGGLLVVFIILNLSNINNKFISETLVEFLGDGLIVAIIYIELTSILENIIAINPENKFGKYMQVALNLLTFEWSKKLNKNVLDEKNNRGDNL